MGKNMLNTDWSEVPEWVSTLDLDEAFEGVMHCRYPRFIMQLQDAKLSNAFDGRIVAEIDNLDAVDSSVLDALVQAGAEFYIQQLDKFEEMYSDYDDDEEDDEDDEELYEDDFDDDDDEDDDEEDYEDDDAFDEELSLRG